MYYVASYVLQKCIKVGAINKVKGSYRDESKALTVRVICELSHRPSGNLPHKQVTVTSVFGQPLGNIHGHQAIHALDQNGKYSTLNSVGRYLL